MIEPYRRPTFDFEKSLQVSDELVELFKKRRTIRDFSLEDKVPLNLIKNAIQVAGRAPSGANHQPWSFCVISCSKIKQAIQQQAEVNEDWFYNSGSNEKWVKDLSHLPTNEKKPFLLDASYLIATFYKNFDYDKSGNKVVNYYAKESAGIAVGLLISALHLTGINTLTYTPTKRSFLNELLDRPKNEKAMIIVAAGVASGEATVPVISKKTLDQIMTFY